LEEKMVISDEVREKANHQDWNELQKLHFIVPYIISEFIDMTDEEKAKFLAKPKTNPIVENPDPIVENPNPVVGKPSDDDKSDSDDDKPDGD
jgi:hypothetical protein